MNTQEFVILSPDALSRLVADAITTALERAKIYQNSRQSKMLSWRDILNDYGISRRTLELWRHLGTGPEYVQVGGRILYERAIFEKFIAAGRVLPVEHLPRSTGRATPAARQ